MEIRERTKELGTKNRCIKKFRFWIEKLFTIPNANNTCYSVHKKNYVYEKGGIRTHADRSRCLQQLIVVKVESFKTWDIRHNHSATFPTKTTEKNNYFALY